MEELKNMRLQSSDLVWVQGRSDSWTPAGEIDELSHLVQAPTNRTSSELQNSNAIPLDSFSRQHTSDPSREKGFGLETNYSRPFDEIKENDFNLNIPRYVDTFEEEPEVDIMAVQKEIDVLEEELKKVQEQMNKYLKELGV